MIVAHVPVESSNVSDESFVVVLRDPRFKSSLFKLEKVFFLEISLED